MPRDGAASAFFVLDRKPESGSAEGWNGYGSTVLVNYDGASLGWDKTRRIEQ